LRNQNPPVGLHLPQTTVGGDSDPDLAIVVDAWDRLPAAVRAGIVAMVEAASTK
jgi:hypothetical protein